MTACLLALAILVSPMNAGTVDVRPERASGAGHCHYSWKVPPSHIDVLRAHHRGSSVRKRVERWSFTRYVAAVMSSGAWPNHDRESAKVGAIAIKQYAWWQILHTCRSWHGQRFAISDGEQYLRREMRPWSKLPTKSMEVVVITWPISLRKGGRFFRTGWSGGGQYDHWHLGEDATRAASRRGWGWRRIIRTFLSPVRIVGDWR